MGYLEVKPYAGINRRFPEHQITGKKEQSLINLWNMMSLGRRIYKIGGAEKLHTTAPAGSVRWQKRIYYTISGDKKRRTFSVIGNKIWRLNENTKVLEQMKISDSLDTGLETDTEIIDATIEVSGQVTTFLCDGKYFYKFNGNEAGAWERLPDKLDVDGNTIKPVFICPYLDRMWVLDKDRNVLLGSENLNPESYDHATDSVLIQLPATGGGFPKAEIVHRGFLYIIHENYFVALSGTTPSTFGIKPGDIISGYGTKAPRSVVGLKTAFGFLNSEDNEYYTSGGTLDSTDKTPLSYPIVLNELMNPVLAHKTAAFHHKRLNAIRIAYVPTGYTDLDHEEIYSLDEKKWCGQTRDRKVSCYSEWNGDGDGGEFVTGRSDESSLLKWDLEIASKQKVMNFDGAAVHYKFTSASYVADDPNDVQFEEFFIDGDPLGNYTIPLGYYIDSRITTEGIELINNQGEVINVGLIEIKDQNIFTNRAIPKIDRSKGRMIRFQIEETIADRKLEFYGILAKFNTFNTKFNKYISGQ